jgi:excisionase family DNA binding protein
MDKGNADSVLTAAEVAQRLKISLRSFEALVQAQRAPPFLRIGRLRRWRAPDVEAWLIEQVPRSK